MTNTNFCVLLVVSAVHLQNCPSSSLLIPTSSVPPCEIPSTGNGLGGVDAIKLEKNFTCPQEENESATVGKLATGTTTGKRKRCRETERESFESPELQGK
ncbi:hypothetical protein RUM44_011941 [Polyplax serrata]|uniref:Secreted protein n=1 Tax=Polyplax serrata TaxID=468196 RepID=A0ABR1BC30_POLSC